MPTLKNRLASETSPYLQQHADNPVDWYPWGEEALQKAREEDRPILLSIGYSACHWCHVMAHESFEDEQTAAIMNKLYINIKIDREERPDLDKIYQTSQALLTQRTGGWPLTMILTPEDQIPFFGGTYFPNAPRHGLPSFKDLLIRVEQFYRQHRPEIENQNASMLAALHKIYGVRTASQTLDPVVVDRARRELEQAFDAHHGGFGSAPKFPHPTNVELLLHLWARSTLSEQADRRALHMAVFTLKKMALGGIHDHLGGGFCRYSVDDLWMIPHFEKMLYDNGPLLALYSEASVITGSRLFERTATETAEWTMREMQSPEGGYYSSLDADSEGEEGKFYVWDRHRVEALLEADHYALFSRCFGLDRTPNFEGKWHLHSYEEPNAMCTELGLEETALYEGLDRARRTLFVEREKRVRPGRDEKILTSWNALMIKGMANAGRHLEQERFIASAESAMDFIHSRLWKNQRLLATYKDGRAHLNAYLDDYAYLIDAALELLQARWREDDLRFARDLTEVLLKHFEDRQHGGFYFTSDDHERLIQRPKSFTDESTPSGNGIAATVLQKIGYLLGETRYVEAAERTVKQAADSISSAPTAHASMLIALERQLNAPQILILRGQGDTLKHWHRRCEQDYAPQRLTFAIPNNAKELPQALKSKAPQGECVAYICEGMNCAPPITDWNALENALEATAARI